MELKKASSSDGEIRSDFDYGSAWYRKGSDPDGLLDVITTLGFNLTEDDPVLDMRWWSLDELDRTTDAIEPRTLPGFVRRILAGEVPQAPLDLGAPAFPER